MDEICCCCCWVASVVSDSVRPHRRQPTRLPAPGILQARTQEWVAISFSSAWKWKVKVKSLSRVRPSATPWTAAYQAPPSMEFSRQEYWSGVPLPSPLSSLTRDQIHVLCSGNRSLNHWTAREVPILPFKWLLWDNNFPSRPMHGLLWSLQD